LDAIGKPPRKLMEAAMPAVRSLAGQMKGTSKRELGVDTPEFNKLRWESVASALT
jgi:hypothetical protein